MSVPKNLNLKNAFDSHVHWQGTGAFASSLDLSTLKSAEGVLQIPIRESYCRGQWFVGYGWDESFWKDRSLITRQTLDRIDHSGPILFMRADRHGGWCNTEALKIAGLWKKWESPHAIEGGLLELDSQGWPTGIVVDRAMEQVRELVPPESKARIREHLQEGARVFNRAGYTHIRDLTCNSDQWNEAVQLAEQNELTVASEIYFDIKTADQVSATLRELERCRRTSPKLLRPKGVKIFYDGALGSEGAFLSVPYRGHGDKFGFTLFDKKTLTQIISEIWSKDFEASVHVIGDEAAHDVVRVAKCLALTGKNGILHLEHAELLRTETIELMDSLDVVCHFQPCHWLTDKAWAREKLPTLYSALFRWRTLEDRGIEFDFGSDAPIEPSSIIRNLEAVEDANNNGLPSTRHPAEFYMQHSDSLWIEGCTTEVSNGRVSRVVFQGKELNIL